MQVFIAPPQTLSAVQDMRLAIAEIGSYCCASYGIRVNAIAPPDTAQITTVSRAAHSTVHLNTIVSDAEPLP